MTGKKKDETSYKQTAFGVIPRSKLIPLEIEGIKKAWDFILEKYKSGKIPITPSFLKKVHQVGFSWIFPEFGGKFRKIEVNISDHTPPKFFLVPQLMIDLCEDIKVRMENLPKIDDGKFLDELIELLTWAHHRFLWIHPFQDYNGRMGRLLINIILLNLNLPPMELKVETKSGRKKYIQALQNADQGDLKELQSIIKSALEETAQDLSKNKKK
ncbi:Fic family protein [Patescibacteria group bacterium]|nr:Fic family protein [Patescibacteria group bacterium]MBU1672854.1 Fic family protein [Patescibacteria group bacterium]MBU1963725.1 Fic family protein [Patescibacteria group bacterium]